MDKEKTSARPRLKKALLAGAVLIVLALPMPLLYFNAKDLADDAMISARYARNLAFGQGLRYNRAPADALPVEGYSNFLWTMALAGGFKLGLHPRVAADYLGGFFALASILVLLAWVRRATNSFLPGLGAALLLATSVPFAVWAVQGLETAMFAALALLAVSAGDPRRPGPLPYLFSFLACLARPDGLIVPAAVFISQLLCPGRDLGRIVKSALAFILPFAAYSAWRVGHFGALVPNVFHAKTGMGLAGLGVGAGYLWAWARSQWPLAALLVLGYCFSLFRSRGGGERPFLLAPGIMIVTYFGFVAAVGGDFMPDYRLVMHLLPLIIGAGVIGLFGESDPAAAADAGRGNFFYRSRGAVLIALLVLVLGHNLWPLAFATPEGDPSFYSRQWHRRQAEWYGRPASWLLRHTDRDDVIACGDIGYIGYVTDVDRILDTNGLVDPYLARLPGAAALASDPDYVLDLRPDYLVVMVNYFPEGMLGHSAFDRAVLARDRLAGEYSLAVELPGWRWAERSLDDGIYRESQVRFRIYQRNDRPAREDGAR